MTPPTFILIWKMLDDAWEAREPMPSVREMQAELGISTTSVVQYHLARLERARIIKRAPGKARSIRLLKRFTDA